MRKKILLASLLLILTLTLVYIEPIIYGIEQAKGQLHVVNNAKPLDVFLDDPHYPDSLKRKIRLIKEVRQYAIDSLGVNNSDNYTTMFDQEGKPILWAVNASPKFEIKAYEWCFPIAGCFPYKGSFVEEKVRTEQKRLIGEGYETYFRSVDGWSTLGYFTDPILSNMLLESEGELAELIVHELTHATLFIKDSADYNENLATFVGNTGALAFLKHKYGEDSDEFLAFKGRLEDNLRFERIMLLGLEKLQQLYSTFDSLQTAEEKQALKEQGIKDIFCNIDVKQFNNPKRFAWVSLDRFKPNNAFFSLYLTYHEASSDFQREYEDEFDRDLKAYLTALKERYGK